MKYFVMERYWEWDLFVAVVWLVRWVLLAVELLLVHFLWIEHLGAPKVLLLRVKFHLEEFLVWRSTFDSFFVFCPRISSKEWQFPTWIRNWTYFPLLCACNNSRYNSCTSCIMSSPQERRMEEELLNEINGVNCLDDLLLFMEMTVPLDLLKSLISYKIRQKSKPNLRIPKKLLNHIRATPLKKEKESSLPLPVAIPKQLSTATLSHIFFKTSPFEKVLPETIHFLILSYLESEEYINIPLLSKTYRRWMAETPRLYNRKNVKICV